MAYKTKLQLVGPFCLLLAITCSSVWGVRHYVNHDGSGHLYISYVMLELLRGNEFFANVFQFNSFAVPNSSGHWLMAGLLTFLSPAVVTKVIVTLTLGLFAAAVIWLRHRTTGNDDPATIMLYAFAVGLNWLWMQGSYNFTLAAAATLFTLGLFHGWKGRIGAWRTIILAVLLTIVFLSHFVSFVVLAGSLVFLAVFAPSGQRVRSLLSTAIALLPTVPLLIAYGSISSAGEPFYPVWRTLTDPASIRAWAAHIVAGDPFVFISRKAFPFYFGTSSSFAVFSPFVWIVLAVTLILLTSLFVWRKEKSSFRQIFPFAVLAAIALAGALFGPDDFGLTNGSILRERALIFSLCLTVPLIRVSETQWAKYAVRLMLIYVILFQTAALWEYALTADAEANEFVSARAVIPENSTLASVVVVSNVPRFHSMPSTQLNNYVGIEKSVIVWDNYELGHYMFPVRTREPADKRFVFEFTTSNVFYLNDPKENVETTLSKLQMSLESGHRHIEHLILFGDDPRLMPLLMRWFEPQPIFAEGRLRVLKHKSP